MTSERGRAWAWAAVGLLVLLGYLFPVYWMILTSLRPLLDTMAWPPQLLPHAIDLSAWQRVLGNPAIVKYFANSMVVGTGTTVLTLALAAPAAYAVAHLPVRGKSFVLLISLASLLFPAVMLATPLFVIFSQLGLTNNYLGLIIANATQTVPFAILILRPHFLSVPTELTDAAMVDGCGRWEALVRVVLPLVIPGLVTTALFTFILGWSDLVFALSLTNTDAFRPVTAGLWSYVGMKSVYWDAVMAFSTLAMLPTLLVFLVAQRRIVAGLTAGAMKF
jgi:multiple sugar transport system permease protein